MPTESPSLSPRQSRVVLLALGLALENPQLKSHKKLRNEVWQIYCNTLHRIGPEGPVHNLVCLPDISPEEKAAALEFLADQEFNLEPVAGASSQFGSKVVTWGVTPGFGCPAE